MVKSGRTHLMDATPVTLGQEFGGYAAQVRYGVERLDDGPAARGRAAAGRHRRRHRDQRARPASPREVIALLAAETGLPLTEARDHFEAQGARDGLVELSGRAAHDRGRPEQDRATTSAGWAPARGPD